MQHVSKTAQVLKYFAQQYGPTGIPRKRLVKAAYMTDLLARQYLGQPVTAFVYIKDHYGPNARELPNFSRELEDAELADEEKSRDGLYTTIRLKDRGTPAHFEFSLGELEILQYVAEHYLSMDLEEFIADVVKVTDPFVAATHEEERLPMELVDNTGRKAVGFDLEKIAAAERQAAEGNYVTLARFADAIRAQAATRHSS